LTSKESGIVLVTQDVASLIQTRMDNLKLRSTVPLVVEIPSSMGAGSDQPGLSEIVLKAIGIKL
jgi:V/A-type H+/Na+-transporting ATPase subunit F